LILEEFSKLFDWICNTSAVYSEHWTVQNCAVNWFYKDSSFSFLNHFPVLQKILKFNSPPSWTRSNLFFTQLTFYVHNGSSEMVYGSIYLIKVRLSLMIVGPIIGPHCFYCILMLIKTPLLLVLFFFHIYTMHELK